MEADAGRSFTSAASFIFSQFFPAQQLAATFNVPIASSADTGAPQQEADSILPKKLISM